MEDQMKHVLSMYDAVMNEFNELFSFSKTFQERMKEEKCKQPYHINLMEELHPNENAHSRILCKLLQYKNPVTGEYEIINSILHYICKHKRLYSFEKIEIKQPIITQETARIDLWIRDLSTRQAIIFENKINNAQDQQAQIARYIERTRAENFREENIFVVYLSPNGKEPEDQSWRDYKENFSDRYCNFSFCIDILQWLKEDVYPNIRQKDVCLQSAIAQYIEYLEIKFQLKNSELYMNIKKLIDSHFELNKIDNTQERMDVLQEKIDNMNEILQSMQSLKEELWEKRLKELPDEWQKKVKQRYPDLECVENVTNMDSQWRFAIPFEDVNERKYYVLIGFDGRLYCQVEYDSNILEEQRKIANSELYKMKEEGILPDQNEVQIWHYFGKDDFEGVFNCFWEVLEWCKND